MSIETTPPPKTAYTIMASAVKKDFIPTETELKQINSFMLCRWISSHPVGIEVANFINNAPELPINVQYWFVRSKLHNVKYISYPKRQKDLDAILDIISEHYKVNLQRAKEYYKILPKEEVDKLMKMYTHIGRIK